MNSPTTLLIIKLLLLSLILFLAYRSLRRSLRDVQSANWPQAEAVAKLSRAVEAPVGQRRGFIGSHFWQVQYTYTVNGERYTSGLVAPFPNTTQANADMMAQKMVDGTQFKVRVNPNNPRETRLATNRPAAILRLAVQLIIYTAAIILVINTSFFAF